jgi:hypothetical protein
MAKHNPFRAKRSFSRDGMQPNHLPEETPPRPTLLSSLFSKAKRNKQIIAPSLSSTSSSTIPLLFTLPLELRQQIYAYVFQDNGISDLRQHLIHGRFCLDRRSYTVYLGLKILFVSKQFYVDALPTAYEQSCFYTSYRTTEADDTTSVFPEWSEDVRAHVKHLALWSDPFSWNRTLGAIEGAGMRLRVLTLCDSNVNNYMRDEGVNICVAEWLLEIANNMNSLRELRFFLAKINVVFKGAGDLRRAVDHVVYCETAQGDSNGESINGVGKDVEMTHFHMVDHSALLKIGQKGERKRTVLLTIATTMEAEKARMLKSRGAWDHGNPKGCFKFQDLGEGEFNDIR